MKPAWSQHLSVVLFVFLFGCQQQPTTLGDAQRAQIVAQVTARQTELIQAFEALDADAAADIQSADNFLAYVTIDGFLDRQTLVDSSTAWFSRRETEQFDPTAINVYPLTSDLAIADVAAAGFITMKDGTKWEGHNVITYIWQRELDGWYVIHQSESWRYNEVSE